MKFYTNVQVLGNNILFRGYEDGKLKFKRIPFKPTLYLSGAGGYTSIFGDELTPRHFSSIKEARAFVKQYKDIDNLEIFGTTDYAAQYIQENWPNDVEFDESLINTLYIDIEVKSDAGFPEPSDALHPIDAITIRSTKSNRYLALSLYDYDPAKTELELSVPIEHIKFDDERELIRAFIELWNTPEFSPDIVTGWNSRGFDIPYIINRIIRLFGEAEAAKLSPWKKLEKRHVEVKGFEMEVWEILGVSSIDLMDAFKKFGHKYGPQESYSLNHISHVILDEKKLSYDNHANMMSIGRGINHVMPNHNVEAPPKFVRYANAIDKLKQEKLRRSN